MFCPKVRCEENLASGQETSPNVPLNVHQETTSAHKVKHSRVLVVEHTPFDFTLRFVLKGKRFRSGTVPLPPESCCYSSTASSVKPALSRFIAGVFRFVLAALRCHNNLPFPCLLPEKLVCTERKLSCRPPPLRYWYVVPALQWIPPVPLVLYCNKLLTHIGGKEMAQVIGAVSAQSQTALHGRGHAHRPAVLEKRRRGQG